jgi:hypothetical protein
VTVVKGLMRLFTKEIHRNMKPNPKDLELYSEKPTQRNHLLTLDFEGIK